MSNGEKIPQTGAPKRWAGWRVLGVVVALAVLGGTAALVLHRANQPVVVLQWVERVDEGNGVSSIRAGTDGCFRFDGSGNRVLVSDAPAFHFGTNENFTVEAWIKAYPLSSKLVRRLGTWLQAHPRVLGVTPRQIRAWIAAHSPENDFGVTPIVDKHHTDSPFQSVGFQLYLDYGRLACQLSEAPMRQLAFQNFVSAGPVLQDGHWHHVAMSVERASVSGGKLYVDGRQVLVFDPTKQAGDLSNTEPLRIGNHANPGLRCVFKGSIGNVMVYRRALSAEEVAAASLVRRPTR